MRGTARTSSRTRQKGQAIVLTAVLFVVICAFVALAIDSGRLYFDERQVQDAADAAALSAGDGWLNGDSYAAAEALAPLYYADDERVYSTASCSPAFTNPAAGGTTWTCSYPSDSSQSLTLTVADGGNAGVTWTVTVVHVVHTAIIQLIGGPSTVSITATSVALTRHHGRLPAIVTFSQAGCSAGPGSSLTVSGNATISVIGDIASSGGINLVGASNLSVTGNISDACPGTPPGVATGTKTGSDGSYPDPNFSPPTTSGLPVQPVPGVNVVLQAGQYASTSLAGGAGCYFLAGGVYDWTGGLTVNGGFMSNELRPPDEPVLVSPYTTRQPIQFWDTNGVACGATVTLSSPVDLVTPLPAGLVGLVVTSTRYDTYSGQSYFRESSPSMCHSLTLGALQDLKVTVTNVPGATGYNLYLSTPPNGCAGPFGLAASLVNGVVEQQGSLGSVSTTLTSLVVAAGFAPNCGAAPDTTTACPPDWESAPKGPGFPNQAAPQGIPSAGDRSDENQCANLTGSNIACTNATPATTVTPGAVIFYYPSGSCMSGAGGGDLYVFSGYQYNWLVVYEPGVLRPPANTCNNTIAGHNNTTVIGALYMPSANITVTGNSAIVAPVYGGVFAYTVTVNGTASLAVDRGNVANINSPAARLTR